MKPTEFTCSDALRALLDDTVREACITKLEWDYRILKTLLSNDALEKILPAGFPALNVNQQELIQRDLAPIIREKIFASEVEMDSSLREEVNALHGYLKSIRDGELPAMHIKNLPKDKNGILAALGLLCVEPTGEPAYMDTRRIRRSLTLNGHSEQALHRDSPRSRAMHAVIGVEVGSNSVTTVFHSVDDFVSEVTEQYRQLEGDYPSLTEDEIRAMLQRPIFKFRPPDLTRVYEGTERDPWPMIGQDPNSGRPCFHPCYKAGALKPSIQETVQMEEEELRKNKGLIEAVKMAVGKTLKEKDGIVIGPSEMVIYNDAQVLHGAGKMERVGSFPGSTRTVVVAGVGSKIPEEQLPGYIIAAALPLTRGQEV
ncbi:MAG: hypothetical protein ACOYJ2_07875 [Rickettsiales bacterium]